MRKLGQFLIDLAMASLALLLFVILLPVACIYRWRMGVWPC